MITIFDEPAIASPSLLEDLEESRRERDSFARCIADDALKGEPLSNYFATEYTGAVAKYSRLRAALGERIRRDDLARVKRDQDAAFATYEVTS